VNLLDDEVARRFDAARRQPAERDRMDFEMTTRDIVRPQPHHPSGPSGPPHAYPPSPVYPPPPVNPPPPGEGTEPAPWGAR
jgi:hypothetical protein